MRKVHKDITIYCVSTSGQYEFFILLRDWNFGFCVSTFQWKRGEGNISKFDDILCWQKENLISDCFREVYPSSSLSRLIRMSQK